MASGIIFDTRGDSFVAHKRRGYPAGEPLREDAQGEVLVEARDDLGEDGGVVDLGAAPRFAAQLLSTGATSARWTLRDRYF